MTIEKTKRWIVFFVIVLTTLNVGLCLRAVSHFDIYVDSFHFMLMAREFARAGTVNGWLGPQGDMFIAHPGPLYKWGYPLMMSLPVALGATPEWAGHAVATLSGLLCPFAAFALLLGLSHKRGPALAAFALTVFSYEITTWSGFVMSDVPSMTTGMLGLALLVNSKQAPGRIFSGLLIAWAAIGRTELLLLTIPCVLLMISQGHSWRALLSFLVPMGLFFLAVVLYLGLHIPRSHFIIGGHTESLWDKLFGRFSDLSRVLNLKFLVRFSLREAPLVFCAGLGIMGLAWRRQGWHLLISATLAMPLICVYNSSVGHDRYYIQIIPGLLIPAALWLGQTDLWINIWPGRFRVGTICVAIALVGMGVQAFEVVRRGNRDLDYRGEVAQWVGSLQNQGAIHKEDVLITIAEKAVHLRTGLSCRSLYSTPPYMDIGGLDHSTEVVLITDDFLVGRKMPGFREALAGRSELIASMESVALLAPTYHLEDDPPRRVEAWRVPWSVAKDLTMWRP